MMTDAANHIQADAEHAAKIRLQQERMRNAKREQELIAESRRKAEEKSQRK